MSTSTWADCPLVFVSAVACPYCRSTRPITIRSEQGGDGSVTRKSICRACSERFIAVIEPPDVDDLPNSGRADHGDG